MIRSSDDRHQRLEFLPSRQVPKARATAALAALLFYRVQSSNPRSVPRNEPAHKAPPPSSPALGYYAKGLPAAVVFAPAQPDRSAASMRDFLLRRLHACNKRLAKALSYLAGLTPQHDALSRRRYAALRQRGHSHGRALRTVADRLLSVACTLLEQQTLFDPTYEAREAAGA